MKGILKVIIIIIDRLLTNSEYNTLLPFVSLEKRKLLQKKINMRDMQNSLLGDILVRLELIRLTGLKNEAFQFAQNKYHKPFLVNTSDIHYNLSHSGNLISAAFNDEPIGIDIETIKTVNYRITRKVFSHDENIHFEQLHDKEKQEYFYTIWTMKEAHLKKAGIGLSRPMQLFDVFSLYDERFFSIPLGKEYAICYACASKKAQELNYRVKFMEELLYDISKIFL